MIYKGSSSLYKLRVEKKGFSKLGWYNFSMNIIFSIKLKWKNWETLRDRLFSHYIVFH